MFKKISRELLIELTDVNQERNIYVHPNPLARNIFWQRLGTLHHLMTGHNTSEMSILDFGGGSGAFLPSLSSLYKKVYVVDLDPKDAMAIVKHFNLQNVEIFQHNIMKEKLNFKVNHAVAADVLEHFQDLEFPISYLKEHIDSGGSLFTSLPTENSLYELGRKIVRKTKPEDHYHPSAYVIKRLQQNGFALKRNLYRPSFFVPIPLFQISELQNV